MAIYSFEQFNILFQLHAILLILAIKGSLNLIFVFYFDKMNVKMKARNQILYF